MAVTYEYKWAVVGTFRIAVGRTLALGLVAGLASAFQQSALHAITAFHTKKHHLFTMMTRVMKDREVA